MPQASALTLPDYVTPDALAQHFGMNARTVTELAKSLGIGCKLGRSIVFFEADVAALIEARRLCQSKSTGASKSGTIAGRLPEGGYAALVKRRTKRSRSGSQPSTKAPRGNVISMDRGQL